MSEKAAEQWAVVELMGHVRTAGRLSEEERFGVKMGRVDIPQSDGSFVTQYFGGSSVYRLTLVCEDAARLVAISNRLQPVHSWEMPKALPPAAEARKPFDYSDSEDDPDRIGY